MKTKTFQAIKFFACGASITVVLLTVALAVYMITSMRFLRIEAVVMEDYYCTVQSITKLLVFVNPFLGLLACISMNIPSKLIMLFTIYLTWPVAAFSCYLLYYIYFEYDTLFGNILDSEFYSRPELNVLIKSWFANMSGIKLKNACKVTMTRLGTVLVLYEVLALGLIVATCFLLSMARNRPIYAADPIAEPPAISELSKVGLNTISLRSKRVVPLQ